MNRGELRAEIAFLVNFNDGQADEDFSATRLNRAIQYVYELELERGKQEGQSHWFRKLQTVSWPASQITLAIPDVIDQANLIGVYDVTTSNPGQRLQIRDTPEMYSDAFWLDKDTLQWGSQGPSEAKQLQFQYLARAETFTSDDDVPQLIPPQFHWMLSWSAAIYLRKIADEKAPQSWQEELNDWRMKYWKFLTRGRPLSDTPTISNAYTNMDSGLLY